MTSVSNVRHAPVYTPPKSQPKETEPNTLVTRQGAPLPELSAPKPEAKQKAGHEESSKFEDANPQPDLNNPGELNMKEAKTKEEALLNADRMLNPMSNEQRGEDWNVLRNGLDGLATDDAAEAAALKVVQRNEKMEKEELSKLSESDRKKYNEVKDTICEFNNKGSEQLALQKMLFQGKLPGEKDSRGEGTTLDHLAEVASGKDLAEGIDRADLTGTLVREMATPSSINQGGRGTCASTALMIDLADKNPAEYARISKGLASKEGKVELADGKTTLEREKETSFGGDDTGRSVNQRIIIPALAEFANGDEDYNDKTGEAAGTNAPQLDKLNDAIHGKDMRYQGFGDDNKDEGMRLIDEELKSNRNVLVGMQFQEPGQPHAGHMVLVTGTSKEDDKDYIHYTNPWGTEERMSREDFAKRLISTNYEGQDDNRMKRLVDMLQGGGDGPSLPGIPGLPNMPAFPINGLF